LTTALSASISSGYDRVDGVAGTLLNPATVDEDVPNLVISNLREMEMEGVAKGPEYEGTVNLHVRAFGETNPIGVHPRIIGLVPIYGQVNHATEVEGGGWRQVPAIEPYHNVHFRAVGLIQTALVGRTEDGPTTDKIYRLGDVYHVIYFGHFEIYKNTPTSEGQIVHGPLYPS